MDSENEKLIEQVKSACLKNVRTNDSNLIPYYGTF